MLDRTVNDLRFAARMLRKSPVFTIVAIAAISLGSGAVTTIFSAMNALVLRPLPATMNGSRLVGLELTPGKGRGFVSATYPLYETVRARTRTLSGLAAWGKASLSIAAGAEGVIASGNLVSANYFSVLGLRPALGRFFLPEEDRTPMAHPVVVVSHAFWMSHLGADSSAIGRTVSVNGRSYTLIGVAPPGFRGVVVPIPVDGWIPLMMQSQFQPGRDMATAPWLRLFGRLDDGVAAGISQTELTTLVAAYDAEHATRAAGHVVPTVRVSMLRGVPEDARGPFLGFMALLLGAAGLVLLIASVNVASLLSARAVARRREMALRAALGAGRARLVTQLLTEILLLFVCGAAGGILFAFAATRAATLISLPTDVMAAPDMTPDWRVMAFALVVSLLTGLVFGLAPALRSARDDISARLRDGSTGSGTRRTSIGSMLIVGQLALSLVLLVAAGLFLRALNIGARVNPGFDRSGISIASFDTRTAGYDTAAARRFYREVEARMTSAPGVTNVAYASFAPLTTRSANDDIEIAGERQLVWTVNVSWDYFSMLKLPVVAGRALSRTDDERALKVAVVNETMAKQLFGSSGAIGRTFTLHGASVTIVGIARDAKYADLAEATPPLAYFSMEQFWQPNQTLLVRSAGGGAQLPALLREAVRSIDPTAPRPAMMTLERATGITLLTQRLAAIVTGALGGVGLLLATLGLYGTIAYSVNRRTREMGIRVALGARRADVLRLVLREGMRLAASGVAAGVLLAAASTRLIARFLFEVSPLDAATFGGMSMLFIAVALFATYLPARRAAAADPMSALRAD